MSLLRGRVQGGRIVVQDVVDLPEGTEVRLEIVEQDGDTDQLDAEDRARLEAAISTGRQEIADGKGIPANQMSFAEQAALMVDREWTDRENRRLSRLMRAAHLSVADASLENVWCDPARGLDKAVIRDLGMARWIRNKQNVIIVGKTGVGKTFLGAALAQTACRNGMRALCTRLPRLLQELGIARADGTYAVALARLAKLDVLVLDDFLIGPLKDQERRDLVEILEDRYGKSSTVVTTQVPTKNWHEKLGDPTMADAICDRTIHNAHLIALRGPSIREKKGMLTAQDQPTA